MWNNQGLLGRFFGGWQSGPEYLGRDYFTVALAAALVLHVAGLMIWERMPHTHVVDIPVRTLNIKLGDDEADPMPAVQPPVNPGSADSVSRLVYDSEPSEQAREQAVTRSMDKIMDKAAGTKEKSPAPKGAASRVAPSTPRQFVREKPHQAAKHSGSTAGNSSKRDAEIMSRYEQLISMWIQKFKFYPPEARAQGMHGDTVVRIRIDRQGNIRYYILEHSTGYQVLDRAAIDMIRRANPVPAVPNDYPAGDLMEFLIPVSYTIE